MSTDRFPDPYDANRVDIRLRPGVDKVPGAVLAAYEIAGAVVTRLETSSYNIHFKVEFERGAFDLRHSNRPANPSNLEYEAELLEHLRERRFLLGPELTRTASGDSNYWFAGDGWTLFKWVDLSYDRLVTDARIDSAGRVLADIHRAGTDFDPMARRGDWPIFSLPEEWAQRWSGRCDSLADHLGADGAAFRELSRRATREISRIDFRRLPQTTCHGDYRPRNLRFIGDDVAVVFDFDTALIASRLFDLGGAVTRFSPLALGTSVPQADTKSGSRLLKAYVEEHPLSDYEWKVLPVFIRWRLIRDVAVYFDRWWLKVGDACRELFDGVAEEIVERAR